MKCDEDMGFEANEIERGFDFANVSFGAFLSAYLGVQLASSPPTLPVMIKISCLLGVVALLGHSLRILAITFVHGLQTTKHTLATVFVFFFGVASYSLISIELSYQTVVMASLGIGWLSTCLLISFLMISRRWIKIYD